MPLYSYVAREKDGKIKEGVHEGRSQEEILSFLQGTGLLVTRISELLEPKTFQKPQRRLRHRMHRGVRRNDMILMTKQLATLVSAGVTLLRSIEIVLQQTESRRLQKSLEEIRNDIRAGQTFHSALTKHPKVFSSFWVNLIRMGEAGGHLSQTLEQLATYLESTSALQNRIVSAMIYPMILLGLSILVVIGFLVKIVPIFSRIFEGYQVELPALTQFIIFLSGLFLQYFPVTFLVAGALFFLTRFYIKTDRGKYQWDWMKLRLPVLGELIRKNIIANFAIGFGALIKSGVPILYSLEIIGKSAGNKVVEEVLEDVRLEVREGKPMAAPLEAKEEIFDPIVVQMVRIGEEIGELGNMLEKVGKFYRDQVETLTARLVTLIEPFAIVVMGAVVGTLVISMYLPIFSISQIAGRG